MQVLPEALDTALLVALIGAPDVFIESNRLVRLGQSGTAVEVMIQTNADYLGWSTALKTVPPFDWQQLTVAAGAWMVGGGAASPVLAMP